LTNGNDALGGAAARRVSAREEFVVDSRGPAATAALPANIRRPREISETAAPQFPIVEPGAVTFAWQGEAESVWLRHFMKLDNAAFELEREASTDWWRLRLLVPDRARFEYKFDIVRNGHGEWINDPLNPKLASDPFGGNSVCETWGYAVPEWTTPGLATAVGSVEQLVVKSHAFKGNRNVGIYLPAGYDESEPYPLVVIHDGYDYIDHAALVPTLDNLIERGDLPPLIAALTQSPDRSVEYVDDPRHVTFVTEELLPALEAAYNIAPSAHNRVLMGASLGAVASLSIAARAPRMFGGVVLKSGSFIFNQRLLKTRHELFERVSAFIDSMSEHERMLHRAFVSCGRYEGLVRENRRMAAFLHHAGVATRYEESRDAHHWGNWRDQTREGLMWCLQPAMSKQPPQAHPYPEEEA